MLNLFEIWIFSIPNHQNADLIINQDLKLYIPRKNSIKILNIKIIFNSENYEKTQSTVLFFYLEKSSSNKELNQRSHISQQEHQDIKH